MNPLLVLNIVLAVGGLALAVVTIVLAIDLFVYKGRYFGQFVQRFGRIVIILTTTGSVALSLVYSEYFGFVPCSLCWLQRIALYPQALMSIVAHKVRDTAYFPLYGIWFSLFGLIVALYQYMYQLIPADARAGLIPCLVDGSADCGTKVIDVFGFVTFPLLSAITFAFLIIIYLYLRRRL